MIETNKPRLEEIPEGEQIPENDDQKLKPQIPVAGIIIMSVLVALIIALVIVVAIINKRVPMVDGSSTLSGN